MQLDEADAKDLKIWVMRKLEDISDADSDVLADYVIALIRTDDADSALEANTTSQLEDFLQDNAAGFVNELLRAIQSRSYSSKPSATGQHSANLHTSPASYHAPQSGALQSAQPVPHQHPLTGSQRRKRNYSQTSTNFASLGERVNNGESHPKRGKRDGLPYGHNDRPEATDFAQPTPTRLNNNLFTGSDDVQGHGLPTLPFDSSGAAAAFLALQAMGLQFPPVARIGSPVHGLRRPRTRKPCVDYNTKGICKRGANCPFDHGTNQIFIPQSMDYDPSQPFMPLDLTSMLAPALPAGQNGPQSTVQRPRRADSTKTGPKNTKNLATIIVQDIPESYFEEEQVRQFFDEFGKIEKVDMHPYKRLAVIQYASHNAAKAAYSSPKVIFNNRFVKVYWHDPSRSSIASDQADGGDQLNGDTISESPTEPEFDRAQFEVKLADAQKKFEEKSKIRHELGTKSRKLEEKRVTLESQITETKKLLASKMREKGIDPTEFVLQTTVNGGGSPNADALKARLAALQSEAWKLSTDLNALDGHSHFSHHVRGAYRGRGSYRGYSARGAYRASKTYPPYTPNSPFKGAIHAGGRYNLDLRPKRVRVSAADSVWTDEKDEALREYLFTLGNVETTEIVPSDEEGDIIASFKDRATAEDFFYGPREIANVGKIHLSWVANLQVTIEDASRAVDEDVQMDTAPVDEFKDANYVRVEYRPDARDNDEYNGIEVDERWIVS